MVPLYYYSGGLKSAFDLFKKNSETCYRRCTLKSNELRGGASGERWCIRGEVVHEGTGGRKKNKNKNNKNNKNNNNNNNNNNKKNNKKKKAADHFREAG
ncbi:hypothetical protein EYF80_028383 [Liparis tanakae]|uniref:Uncharacterized protein n=1 Tax=Liparis tanakae TaxID=230148 RepID=A0A4Z2H6L0_9TELE|nr:hypothetical protein EYF80_028383 [Liparis tanakae]